MDGVQIALFLDLGLIGVAALCFGEKFVPVLSSGLLLIAVGMTAVDHPLECLALIAASSAGSVLGATSWYVVGRSVGRERSEAFVERFGKYVLLRPALYRRMMGLYGKHRFLVTLIGQTVPAARNYLPLPAGILGLSFIPFLVATTLGTLMWNGPLIGMGYIFRNVSCPLSI